MNTPQNSSDNQQGLEELQLENIRLKKKLEQEELLHKSLFRQWSELNNSVLAKGQEQQQFNSGSLFYKYAFYVILLALIPGYYFLGRSKGEGKISSDPQVASSPKPIINQSPNSPDTVQLTDVIPVKKKAVQTDTVLQKLPTINKPVLIDKPLTSTVTEDEPITGSARDLIYSQGWDAYYKQLRNPYQRSSKKFEIWLEGWKDGEKGIKKLLAKDQ